LVPQIVAAVDFLNESANIPTTSLFTPAADGWYRVNAYYTHISGTGGAQPHFYWTDEAGVSQQSQVDQARSIYVKGGNPIQADATSYAGTAVYNLRFVIESL
jgi:hypothetical protein